ncbi:MAG TPA: hypothetical protein PK708_12590 [Candidatus Competibacter sp.]|nr:hypothetical protein [Candidatus Competibacter sp.]
MPSFISRLAIFIIGLSVGMSLLSIPLVAIADDAYLREIEDEAKRQAATLTTSQLPPPVLVSPVSGTGTERLAPGLDRAKFEQALRERLPKEAYIAFQRLDPANQQQVYESYRNDSSLAGIGQQIARRASGKNP